MTQRVDAIKHPLIALGSRLRPRWGNRRGIVEGEKMRKILAGGLMLLVAACSQAPVPVASPALDDAGKQFAPPAAGQAAVYFYNPTATGPNITVAVGVNTMGQVAPNTWMRVERAPGFHELRCISPSSANATMAMLVAGVVRFVDVQQAPGQANCLIRETTAEQGRAAVMQGNRVSPLQ